jgi:hypothetical protein
MTLLLDPDESKMYIMHGGRILPWIRKNKKKLLAGTVAAGYILSALKHNHDHKPRGMRGWVEPD